MKKILFLVSMLFFMACGDKVDSKGFYIEGKMKGYNNETRDVYDKNGYDKDGINNKGYDINNNFQEEKYFYSTLNKKRPDIYIINKDKNNKKIDEYKRITNTNIIDLEYEFRRKLAVLLSNYIEGKREFETTSEYNTRVEAKKIELRNNHEEIKKGFYLCENQNVSIKYDADFERWEIYPINSILLNELSFNETGTIYFNNELSNKYYYYMKKSEAKSKNKINPIVKFVFTFEPYSFKKTTIDKNIFDIKNIVQYYCKVVGYQIIIDGKVEKAEFFK